MIISRTPYRISLFGGGTDYPEWYVENGGAVIGTTINKYCYVSIRELPPFFEHKHRIAYSRVEAVKTISEIEHPAVRAVLQESGVNCGVEIHYDGDLPARSGLGSSSAFTVGMLNAVNAFHGKRISSECLAKEAIRIEQDVIGEAVGSQDQIWAAFGGMNRIDFSQDGSFNVSPIIMPAERKSALQDHLMLFFTGFSRYADVLAKKQKENFKDRKAQLSNLRSLVDEVEKTIGNPTANMREVGLMLAEGWKNKKELHKEISTKAIDEIYDAGIKAGAWGGKLLGAGGGGFLAFLAPLDAQRNIRKALNNLIYVDAKLSSSGSDIIVYEPEKSADQ